MILEITAAALVEELNNIGVHQASVDIFNKRAYIRPLKLFNVRMPAANILKQEMLSAGADCAIHASCVAGKIDFTDVLLLGTTKHYYELLRKLQPMTFFGLPQLAAELKSYLEQQPVSTVLADGRVLDYSKMSVMGIINLTQDSFYSVSRQSGISSALKTAERMLSEGADILDIGGESSRPGAQPIGGQDEIAKVSPVAEAIKKAFPASIISVDTYRAETARAVNNSGADLINDITAAGDKKMAEVVRESKVPLIIMHMQGEPQNMQDNPHYADVLKEVCQYLAGRRDFLFAQGIARDKLIIDPGIGFGKSLEHNLSLLKRLQELKSLGLPVLLAASRKATIGKVLGNLPAEERLEGTIALSCQAVMAGAQLVRVHDVKENIRAIRMLEAVRQCR